MTNRRAGALVPLMAVAIALSASHRSTRPRESDRAGQAALAAINPARALEIWDPVSEDFRGCSRTCGSRVGGEIAGVVHQPGGKLGDRVYCLVSGVAFQVKGDSAVRGSATVSLYFCCNECADYFSEHRGDVLRLRSGKSATS